ncbi:MAG: cysteine desulfurase [Clostridia bacterium]|nr:MAG: cysteine desulfurase [Clostridia bacterium]
MDHMATTPLLPEVLEAMLPYFTQHFGNPASLHSWGDAAREAVEASRAQVAAFIGARPEEIVFTGSGTEANNMAIKGLAQAQEKKGRHIVVSAIEHFSVLQAARTMEKRGFEVTLVPVDADGLVSPAAVAASLRPDTVLVSVMLANPEVGTIEPVREIATVVKEHGAIMHTDAVAAAGQIPINVEELGVDALSLAACQFYGPKGVGALYLRRGVRLIPLMDGGVQEGGRRPGTDNVPGIVGMGRAAALAPARLPQYAEHLQSLRERLFTGITASVEHILITGHRQQRLPGHASFCVRFIEGEAMLMLLDARGVACSSGSACTSRALKTSHVLTAMNVPAETAQGSLVFSLGLDNTAEDVDHVVEVLPPVVQRLRQMSPLWDKFLKGKKEGS